MYLSRKAEPVIHSLLNTNPVTAIVGPRQCGKSTLAKEILKKYDNSIYLDLELPSDLRKLTDPEQFFLLNRDVLICIDEIQKKPDLFPVLRALGDRTNRSGQFLILGSASPDLLRQSSQTLAGRISYYYLSPFTLNELQYTDLHTHWLRGGFPKSWFYDDTKSSIRWRNDFIATYLEKDVPSLGFSVSSQTIRRLWTMLAHTSGQVVNKSNLAGALGISGPTVTSYLDILEKTFMVRILLPYFTNVKKRLIKSPKIYIRDTGIMHALLDIDDTNTLMGHTIFGQSWETYALEQIVSTNPSWRAYFYRTSDGSEIDLLMTKGEKVIAVEFKASFDPKVSAGFFHSLETLNIKESFIICPFLKSEWYPYTKNTIVASLDRLSNYLEL